MQSDLIVLALVLSMLLLTPATTRAVPNPVPVGVLLPATRDANLPGGLPLTKLLDRPMRDPNVTLGPDGNYYLTGTTSPDPGYTTLNHNAPHAQMWHINDGVRLWRSPDLKHWEPLGLVWSIDRDAADTWVHWWPKGEPNPGVSIWAPEIHYLKDTWWIPYCTKLQDGHLACGLLRSTSGKPEGPYREVQPAEPLGDDDDASIFQDTDGAVYYLCGGTKIARMNADCTALAEPIRIITFAEPTGWGEGIFISKVDGKYVLTNAGNATYDAAGERNDIQHITYDCFSAVASGSIYGPYSKRLRAIPHAGHNNLFQDKAGKWWSTYFGSDPMAPFFYGHSGRASILPVTIDRDGHVRAARTGPRPIWRYQATPPPTDWIKPTFDDSGWRQGGGAFGDPAVAEHGQVTDVGTAWTDGDVYLRTTFTVAAPLPRFPNLFWRHNGPIKVYVNGRLAANEPTAIDDYQMVALPAGDLLHEGENTVAVQYSRQPGVPAYVDVGIVDPPPAVELVPTSRVSPQTWRFTEQRPPDEWNTNAFDDHEWQSGAGAFGNGTLWAQTTWKSNDIWMRRSFTTERPIGSPVLRMSHDGDADVFIDGVPATVQVRTSDGYQEYDIADDARAALDRPGPHTLAVHAHKVRDRQSIDVGIVERRPPEVMDASPPPPVPPPPPNDASPRVEIYPAPVGAPVSQDFRVMAGADRPDQPVAAYRAGYAAALRPEFGPYANVSYAYFDFAGHASIAVTPAHPFRTVEVLPTSLGLRPTVTDGTIRLDLAKPANLTFVFDGKYEDAHTLHLFASAIETDAPDPADPNVLYIGPGYRELTVPIEVTRSGQTVYIAGGAYVVGQIRAVGRADAPLQDVTIRGRGIICSPDGVTINCENQRHLTISGLIATRAAPYHWTTVVSRSQDVTISDLKAICPLYASVDGIDLLNSSDVTIDRCFIRTADDCIAIKGFPADPQIDPASRPPVRNITVKRSQFWSDSNNALGIGAETNAERFENITFADSDILYVDQDLIDRAALAIVALNATRFSDIHYRDLRIGPCGQLILLQFATGFPGAGQPGGQIIGNLAWPGGMRGITFENVHADGGSGSRRIRIAGIRPQLGVRDVDFDNVTIDGVPVRGTDDPHFDFADPNWSAFHFKTTTPTKRNP